jgi:hypothetical protein
MLSGHPTPPADGGLLAVAGSATGTPATLDIAAMRKSDSDADAHWRAWRDKGTNDDQATARRMSLVFAVVAVAVLAWLVFQLS